VTIYYWYHHQKKGRRQELTVANKNRFLMSPQIYRLLFIFIYDKSSAELRCAKGEASDSQTKKNDTRIRGARAPLYNMEIDE